MHTLSRAGQIAKASTILEAVMAAKGCGGRQRLDGKQRGEM